MEPKKPKKNVIMTAAVILVCTALMFVILVMTCEGQSLMH